MLSIMRNLRQKLAKSKSGVIGRIAEDIRLRGKVDEELMEEIEDILLRCDTGVEMSQVIMDRLRDRIRVDRIDEAGLVQDALQEVMRDILLSSDDPDQAEDFETPDFFDEINAKPWVIVFVGVNGVGKTTSIGKIAHRFRQMGKSVLIVAADTFRAAAYDQLKVWAERSGAEFLGNPQGKDPSAVTFDAIKSAMAKGHDIVMIDTAGRLHTKSNLMEELGKIKRVIAKQIPEAPHDIWLVLDANTGQNGIVQAQEFLKAVGVTGIILSKLDGTAKGGVVLAIHHKLSIPIRYLGVGEKINDLVEFDPADFVDALLKVME